MTTLPSVLCWILLLAVANVGFVAGARILAIFPVPLRDHQIVFRPLVESLMNRGHNLTIVTTDPQIFTHLATPGTMSDGSHQVELIDLSFAHHLTVLNMLKNHDTMASGSEILRTVFEVMRTVAETELKSEQIQTLLTRMDHGVQYDAVLVDWSGPALMNAFAYKGKAPLIGISPGGAYINSHEAMGNPNHPVAFPSIFMPFSEDLSLFQRVASTIFTLKYRYLYFNEELPKQDEIVRNFFGPRTPSIWEIESNADLLLVNCYEALGNARSVGPTTIYMGGIHAISDRSLPWHLKHFLDGETDTTGIAYINLGAILTRAFVDSHRMDKLIRILEKSSFDILLNTNEIGSSYTFNTTAKIYQGADFEQESVLAHEEVKLFITFGGQRDIEDAIHHKVPVLGLTFSSNLEHYLLQIAKHEAGLIANIDIDTTTELLSKIESFAITERYQKNMNKLHNLLLDAPMRPLDRGVWWIEYVLRNRGTQHLRHSWVKLSWMQYLLLDVVLAIAITVGVILFAVFAGCLRIRRYSKSLPFEKMTRRTKAKMS